MKTFKVDNKTGINHEGAHPNQPLKYLTRHCPFKCVSGASKQLRKGHILVRSPKIFIN